VDPNPYEEAVVFQTTLPLYLLNTYIPYSTTRFIESLDIHITHIMTTPHLIKQIKSYWYYIFWSIATLAVVGGQIYVGLGYRDLTNALKLTLT
jgi:hypothetical protein